MPVKPTKEQIEKSKKALDNPDFSKNALRATINDVPEIRDYLLAKGLVYEVKE